MALTLSKLVTDSLQVKKEVLVLKDSWAVLVLKDFQEFLVNRVIQGQPE